MNHKGSIIDTAMCAYPRYIGRGWQARGYCTRAAGMAVATMAAKRPMAGTAYAIVAGSAAAQGVILPHSALFRSSRPGQQYRPISEDGGRPRRPSGAADFESLDIFGEWPIPPTSVDACLPNGFSLNNGVQVLDGSGVLLVGGEAFAWRPWYQRATVLNSKGQWEVDSSAFGLLGLVWPRPGM